MNPTFQQLADVIRTESGLRRDIGPEDRIERDLGIVGDDAVELLGAVGRRFSVSLADASGYVARFDLAPDEVLFSSEGLGLPIPRRLIAALGVAPTRVRDLSLGELHAALMAAMRDSRQHAPHGSMPHASMPHGSNTHDQTHD